MTAFDPGTLHRLVDETCERAFVLELARTFSRMLTGRVGRIRDAVAAADPDDAMDAVLSLKVSAAMVGATELAVLACDLERVLRAGDLPVARMRVAGLAPAARRAGAAIEGYVAGFDVRA